MSEVIRHFPLTQEQQNALKELRESAKNSLTNSHPSGIARIGNNIVTAELARNIREKLVGQNTLRFVIQHTVKNETGLSNWFDFKQYMALDQLLISKRLGAC